MSRFTDVMDLLLSSQAHLMRNMATLTDRENEKEFLFYFADIIDVTVGVVREAKGTSSQEISFLIMFSDEILDLSRKAILAARASYALEKDAMLPAKSTSDDEPIPIIKGVDNPFVLLLERMNDLAKINPYVYTIMTLVGHTTMMKLILTMKDDLDGSSEPAIVFPHKGGEC